MEGKASVRWLATCELGRGERQGGVGWMSVAVVLGCVVALLGTAVTAIPLARTRSASPIVYGASLAASLVCLAASLVFLLSNAASASTLTLPIGLPWLGAH